MLQPVFGSTSEWSNLVTLLDKCTHEAAEKVEQEAAQRQQAQAAPGPPAEGAGKGQGADAAMAVPDDTIREEFIQLFPDLAESNKDKIEQLAKVIRKKRGSATPYDRPREPQSP